MTAMTTSRSFVRRSAAALMLAALFAGSASAQGLIPMHRLAAALASEASGQRSHFIISARAGHSPETGSSARAALDKIKDRMK